MSKGIETPKDWELFDDLKKIYQLPIRIETLDRLRLGELLIYLNKTITRRVIELNFN